MSGGRDPFRGAALQGQVIVDQKISRPYRWPNGLLQARESGLQTSSGDPAYWVRSLLPREREPEGIRCTSASPKSGNSHVFSGFQGLGTVVGSGKGDN